MEPKAAFFDRDGTLIEHVDYLDSIENIKIIPESIHLCKYLQSQGYKLFIVTNQSGIGRGLFSVITLLEIHNYLHGVFAQCGVFFEKYYFCPHHPTEAVNKEYLVDCNCRKPGPGMLLRAAKEFNIDLKKSLMFGDKIIDIKAGQAAGCKSFYIQDFLNKFNLKNFDFNSFLIGEKFYHEQL
ncbi:MAG: HAD family hydrolase [bacterium]